MCSASTAVAACAKGPPFIASSPTSLPASPPPRLFPPRAWRALYYCRAPSQSPRSATHSCARAASSSACGLSARCPTTHPQSAHAPTQAHSHIDHTLQPDSLKWTSTKTSTLKPQHLTCLHRATSNTDAHIEQHSSCTHRRQNRPTLHMHHTCTQNAYRHTQALKE
jgi:hypothetical protein